MGREAPSTIVKGPGELGNLTPRLRAGKRWRPNPPRLGVGAAGAEPATLSDMEVHLRTISELSEALALADRLDELGAEQSSDFREDPYPLGSARAFLEAELSAPETLLLVAESAAGEADLGLLLVGPLQEPLTRERVPLLLLLHTSPEVRHRGLARELVAEAWAQLAARGATRFAGRVGHNDDALISMGERWGFTRRWEWIERER